MSGSVKLGLAIIATVVAVYIAIKLVTLLTPFLILAAIGLIVYGVVSRKALSGGRRTLP
jgi:hypothetical protein